MDSNDIRTKITIIDNENKQEVTIPLNLSLTVTQMLVVDAMKSNLKVIIEPIL